MITIANQTIGARLSLADRNDQIEGVGHFYTTVPEIRPGTIDDVHGEPHISRSLQDIIPGNRTEAVIRVKSDVCTFEGCDELKLCVSPGEIVEVGPSADEDNDNDDFYEATNRPEASDELAAGWPG